MSTDKIVCEICGEKTHHIELHLKKEHPSVTLETYMKDYPDAPLLSDGAKEVIEKIVAGKAKPAPVPASKAADNSLRTVFLLGEGEGLSATGSEIPITVLPSGKFSDIVPQVDPAYVFDPEVLKTLMMGIELNIPTYLWGHAGTGKSTIFEQIAARTNRPMIRVQHTANMEEDSIVGGWRLRDGHTVFELGPLPLAMKNGWLYLGDEYDFGRPEVSSLYQAVLEGKPLFIKEADEGSRVIHPHPNFRFCATGNTNGQGDETGLYQGTNLQNAAAYERFGIVDQLHYMESEREIEVIVRQAGVIHEDAEKLVRFAASVRKEFTTGGISNPISPRSLIYAARIGHLKMNYIFGLEKAFINRLTAVDAQAVLQFAKAIFPARLPTKVRKPPVGKKKVKPDTDTEPAILTEKAS